MELVAGFGIRPCLFAHEIDRSLIQFPELVGGLHVEAAARNHRLRAPLLERGVVEERVGPGIQDFVAQRRRFGRIAGDQRELSRVHPFEHTLQPREIHRLKQAVGDRLIHQRVIGNLPVTDQVLRTGELIGEDGGDQVFSLHALQRRGDFSAAAEAEHGECARRIPAPARAEHRRVEHRLHQQVLRGGGLQVLEHVLERETVLRTE